MPKREENEINIMVLLRALLKRVWLVILATVLGAALLFTYSKFFVTPMYASTAKLYVNNRKNDATNSGYITDAEISASKKLVDTYLTILKTPDTLDMVIESAGIDCTSGQLMNMISAGSVNSTEIFYITVTASNPDLAQRVAQKIVDILPQRISDVIEGSSVKIIQEPRVPSSKSSPNIANYTLIGGFLGLILTCFVIVVLELLDNKIRDGEYPSNLYGIKTLATIPDVEDDSGDNYGETSGKKRLREKSSWFINKKKKYKNLADVFIPCDKLPFRASEAYKMLRTGILNLKKEETSCDVIGVTSSCPSEGKSTLAIYLSYTFAQQGKKVLLIEGDLRKPVVAKRLKLSPAVGLSDMVLETTEGAIQTSSYLENWKVICAGRTEDNPSEILGSHKMEVLISELRKDFDCIIIDLPPINEVTDSIAVSGCLDGMLFAIKENGTTKMELETAMNHLAFSKAELLGFVITNSSADAKSKYYKKGYYA